MKINFLAAGLLLWGASVLAVETIAEWDFAEDDFNGDEYIMVLCGDAKIVEDAERGKVLSACSGNHSEETYAKTGCGIRLKSAVTPELLPLSGFELQMPIRWKKPSPAPKKPLRLTLVDGSYKSKAGFSLMINVDPVKGSSLFLAVGMGDKVQYRSFAAPQLGDDKWHDLAVRYENGAFTIRLDNRNIGTCKPPKAMAPLAVRLRFGDRVARTYQPFPGLIGKIKLIGLKDDDED